MTGGSYVSNYDYVQISEMVLDQMKTIIVSLYGSINNFKLVINGDLSINVTRLSDNKLITVDFSDEPIKNITSGASTWKKKIQTKFTASLSIPSLPSLDNVDRMWIVKFKRQFNPIGYSWPNGLAIKEIYDCAFYGLKCITKRSVLMNLYVQGSVVEAFFPDKYYHAQVLSDINLATQPIGAFIKRIGGKNSSVIVGDGNGSLANRNDINVFIVDTGISQHPDLNVVGGRNFTTADPNIWQDFNGHGTHVSGIVGAYDNSYGIAGVAPGVRLWAIKALGDDGSGLLSNIISALNWILSSKNTVWSGYGIVNMSIAGPVSTVLDDAVDVLINNGIPVSVSAGNSNTNAINYSPGRLDSAITVGATGINPYYNTLAYYSNYGSVLDILAPGSNIYSTYLNGSYTYLSGTSMAAPVITGTIAVMLTTSPPISTPTSITFSNDIRTTLLNASSLTTCNCYDGTIGSNPRINLPGVAVSSGTPNVSVWVGSF